VQLGYRSTVQQLKFPLDVAEHKPTVTVTGPVVVPAGTVTVICPLLSTVKLVAAVPLNDTPVAPVKSAPLITTVLPTNPVDGVKLLIETFVTVKFNTYVSQPETEVYDPLAVYD